MSTRRPMDEQRLADLLGRLAEGAPESGPAPRMTLRRARRRIAATAVAAMMAVSSGAYGAIALTRTFANPPVPAPAAVPPCSFESVPLGPLPKGYTNLISASGASATDVWLGGSVHDGRYQNVEALLLHWDGATSTHVPTAENLEALNAVAAFGPDDVWAAGQASTRRGPPWPDAFQHWDGTSWSRVADPGSKREIPAGIYGLSGTSGHDIWAVGYVYAPPNAEGVSDSIPFAEHFDGGVWNEVQVPGPAGPTMTLQSVAAIDPNDAWAVGGDLAATGGTRPLVVHWDGAEWSIADEGLPADATYWGQSVAGSAPDNVWMAALALSPDSDAVPGIVARWDGTSWSTVAIGTGGGIPHIGSVAVRGTKDVWIAGYTQDPATGANTFLVRWFNGTDWVDVPVGEGQPDPGEIRALSVIDGQIWAIGSSRLDEPDETGNRFPHFVEVCR